MLAINHLRQKVLGILTANPDAQEDLFLLTLLLIDTMKPGELRLLQTTSEVFPNATMDWINSLIREAKQTKRRACSAA